MRSPVPARGSNDSPKSFPHIIPLKTSVMHCFCVRLYFFTYLLRRRMCHCTRWASLQMLQACSLMNWFSPGISAGLVDGQFLHKQGAGHRGQAAADPRCPRRAPASLGGGHVAGSGRQSGSRQLGSLRFSSASSGENLHTRRTRSDVCMCLHACICVSMDAYVYTVWYACVYMTVSQPRCHSYRREHVRPYEPVAFSPLGRQLPFACPMALAVRMLSLSLSLWLQTCQSHSTSLPHLLQDVPAGQKCDR